MAANVVPDGRVRASGLGQGKGGQDGRCVHAHSCRTPCTMLPGANSCAMPPDTLPPAPLAALPTTPQDDVVALLREDPSLAAVQSCLA